MTLTFKKAERHKVKLKLALAGPSGSGKTLTALKIAKHLGSKVALIDSEHGSASLYADHPDAAEFDTLELTVFHPDNYRAALQAAVDAGYDLVIIDSLSHEWAGKGGALEMVDQASARYQGNSYAAWRDVTPSHNALIEAIVAAPVHVIATMRAKTEYVQEKDEKTGKTKIRKVGLAPIQRSEVEYEFSVFGMMTAKNELVIDKTRCPALEGKIFAKPGQEIADILTAWLSDGAEPAPKPPAPPTTITPEQRKAIIVLAGGDKSPCLDRILKLTVDAFKIQKLLDLPAGDYEEFCKAVTMNRTAIEAESEDVRKVAEDSFLKFAQACGRDAAIAIIESVAGVRAVEHVEDGDLKPLIARFEQEAEARVRAAKKASK